jgi:aromatic ring-opening dioxygenase LigB subunit
MSLVFAAIAPHGTLAVPDAPAAAVEGSEATQRAMQQLGHRFEAARPEATIVLTPHNVHVDGHFAVVLAGAMRGTLAEWDAPSVVLDVPIDLELATQLVVALHDADIPVVGVSFGGNDPATATAPLDWGALIPLWVMGGRRDPQVPAVVGSPARDRPFEEHVHAGEVLARAVEASPKRIALIASADHGHAHDADGPYGYDPAAKEYDARIVELVRTNTLGDLLQLDGEFVERAKADSFWQMLMLHGALGDGWRGELLSYEAPTYFGMLCAAYERGAAEL